MGIKKKTEDKILDVANNLKSQTQARFVNWVAEQEGWDFETAWSVCNAEHPEIQRPEYSLGYKMSDPILQTALHMQRKKNREKAREQFRETLTPEELELYDKEDQEETRKKFRKELKKKEKGSEE